MRGASFQCFLSSGFLSLERQETIQTMGLNGIMSSNIIGFQSEVEKRRVPDVVAAPMVDPPEPSDRQYVIELEHEILELQQQVCALHRDLERERSGGYAQ
jgi:hypothetical protein